MHAVDFYEYALPHLPEGHRFNGGLVFIGGVHLARTWGMATYTTNFVQALLTKQASFRQQDPLTRTFSWTVSNNASWQVNSGPLAADLEEAARLGRPPKRKCIAIIAFSLGLDDSVWASHFRNRYPQSEALSKSENRSQADPSIWSSFSIAGERSMTQGKSENLSWVNRKT